MNLLPCRGELLLQPLCQVTLPFSRLFQSACALLTVGLNLSTQQGELNNSGNSSFRKAPSLPIPFCRRRIKSRRAGALFHRAPPMVTKAGSCPFLGSGPRLLHPKPRFCARVTYRGLCGDRGEERCTIVLRVIMRSAFSFGRPHC